MTETVGTLNVRVNVGGNLVVIAEAFALLLAAAYASGYRFTDEQMTTINTAARELETHPDILSHPG